jgi:hypothetical protein
MDQRGSKALCIIGIPGLLSYKWQSANKEKGRISLNNVSEWTPILSSQASSALGEG